MATSLVGTSALTRAAGQPNLNKNTTISTPTVSPLQSAVNAAAMQATPQANSAQGTQLLVRSTGSPLPQSQPAPQPAPLPTITANDSNHTNGDRTVGPGETTATHAADIKDPNNSFYNETHDGGPVGLAVSAYNSAPKFADERDLAGQLAERANVPAPVVGNVRIDETSTANTPSLGPAAQFKGAQAGQVGFGATTAGNSPTVAPTNAGPTTQLDRNQDQQLRDAQVGLTQNLQGAVAGDAPSVADLQFGRNLSAAQRAALSLQASQRGGNAALAGDAASRQLAESSAKAVNDAAVLKAQETAVARGQLADTLQGARGQDITANSTQAGLTEAQRSQQATLTSQASQIDAQLAAARQQFNATQTQEASQRVAELEAQRQTVNAQLAQGANQRNAELAQQNQEKLADLAQQVNMFNATAFNDTAKQNASLKLDQLKTNAENELRARGMGDAEIQNALTDLIGMQQAINTDNINYFRDNIARWSAIKGAPSTFAQAMGAIGGVVSGASQGAGVLAVASDKRSKKDIQPADMRKLSPVQEKTGITHLSATPLVDFDPSKFDRRGWVNQFAVNAPQEPQQQGNLGTSVSGFTEGMKAGKEILKQKNEEFNAQTHVLPDPNDPANAAARRKATLNSTTANPGFSFGSPTMPPVAATPTLTAASDKKSKKRIEAAVDSALQDFLKPLNAYEYSYKDPEAFGAAPGRHTSVMAQELQKSRLGNQAVKKGPEGKLVVDYGRLAGIMLASQASIDKRLVKLEGKGN